MFAIAFSQEYYDHDLMKKNRSSAIAAAKTATKWGIILGKPNQYCLSYVHPNSIGVKNPFLKSRDEDPDPDPDPDPVGSGALRPAGSGSGTFFTGSGSGSGSGSYL